MKIIIETNTEAEPSEVFAYFKQKALEGLWDFEISIEGTELRFKTK